MFSGVPDSTPRAESSTMPEGSSGLMVNAQSLHTMVGVIAGEIGASAMSS